MATDKKSFVLYCDLIHTVEHLSNEQAGELFKHLLEYVNDMNPESDNPLINIAFEPIKQSLKRDLKKYEKYISKQRENGKKGGRPKKPKVSQKTQPFLEKPKKADSDSVSVNDTVNVNDIDKNKIFYKWLEYRQQIKKPITAKSTLTQLANRFNKESLEKITFVVNTSIENNWQGLFWDKYTEPKSNNPQKPRVAL